MTAPSPSATPLLAYLLYAAVDIGGTKIAGALVDSAGTLAHRVQLPTPAKESGTEVLAVVHRVLDHLAAAPDWAAVTAVGIGSAGPVDLVGGTVSPVNIPGWREFPLTAEVAAHPAVVGRPVALAGDGVAMAAAEHWRGAARGAGNALCLVVSTGVGAGLVLNGAVHPGPSGNAGHLGHISVDLDGERCPCGSYGCLENIASGTAIARRALAGGWEPRAGTARRARWPRTRWPGTRWRWPPSTGRRRRWRPGSPPPPPWSTCGGWWSAVGSRRPDRCCSNRSPGTWTATRRCRTCTGWTCVRPSWGTTPG